jgi:hypothetical protein
MPYRYSCPVCRRSSRPYWREGAADHHGQVHRDDDHGGDHPYGEHIEYVPYALPDRGEAGALLLVVGLILIGLLVKII